MRWARGMFSAATSWLKTAASGLPFSLGAPIEYEDHPVWTSLREGKLTEDGSAVVVFVCEAKAGDARLELAKHAVQKAQTLRHPTVLHVRSSHETTTSVYLAAEPMLPLAVSLAKARGAEKSECIAWGVSQLCDAVDFLGKSGLVHGNIGAHSVFVTASGDWKLSGLELLSKVDEIPSHLRPHHATFDRRYQAPEIQGSEWSIVEPGATDTWSLGCVLFEAFDGNFASMSDLKRTSSIPPALLRDYKRLCQQDPARRITPSALKEGAFFQGSTTVAVCSFLELLPVGECLVFFWQLSPTADLDGLIFRMHTLRAGQGQAGADRVFHQRRGQADRSTAGLRGAQGPPRVGNCCGPGGAQHRSRLPQTRAADWKDARRVGTEAIGCRLCVWLYV